MSLSCRASQVSPVVALQDEGAPTPTCHGKTRAGWGPHTKSRSVGLQVQLVYYDRYNLCLRFIVNEGPPKKVAISYKYSNSMVYGRYN